MLGRWWLIYVSLVVGGLIGWFAGANLFDALMPETLARVLTCVLIGGGSQLVHMIIARSEDLLLKASSRAEW